MEHSADGYITSSTLLSLLKKRLKTYLFTFSYSDLDF
jgi:hypothetical protein